MDFGRKRGNRDGSFASNGGKKRSKQEASSSASHPCYHVFLSFRGADTRKTFTAHLHKYLGLAGFHTFLDDDEIEKGEEIKSELERAIRESMISIIVLSENYASSTWCLEELVMILKRKPFGHTVLPVFYHVDPCEVRWQSGKFEKAFEKHEENLKSEIDELEKEKLKAKLGIWRAALRDVANLKGMNIKDQADGNEAKFIKEIINVVGDKISCTPLTIDPCLVGMDSRVLKLQSEGVEDKMTCDVQELEAHSNGAVNMSCFGCTCPNIKQRYRLGKEAEEMIARVKELTDQVSHFEEISHARPPPPELEFPSNKNYVNFNSRTGIFKEIVDALKDSSCNIVGVHGPGGVGKTTLVEEVGKQLRHDGTFKQVPIAVVSKDFNVKEVQSKLADKLGLELDANLGENERARRLCGKFTNGERYLVILDDIWGAVDFNDIGIPIMRDGKTGCKVLLTARNENLLKYRMEVDKSFPIEVLQTQEAWTLFEKVVGNPINDESLAQEVCEKCKGLPVAINALGAALRGKPDHAWRTARDKLASYMLREIEDIDPSISASLKLSYEMLHSSDSRSCFLLCCLFPEDAEILIDDLTRHCVARGDLLSPNPGSLEEARNAVLTAVDALKSANLLSNDINRYGIKENFVRIHDVIRDVGISIGRDEKAFLVDHVALRWPMNPKNGPSTISINFKDIKRLPDGLVYPQLHTLMLYNSKLSDVEVPDNFFDGMTQLTVLTITRMRMRRLPSSLGKLTNLRMLYLNDCELEDIAILKDLKSNLEVLSLRDCRIEELPPDVRLLTRLRVLDLQGCYELVEIPQGVISNLTSLEEVYFPVAPWYCSFTFSFLEELKRSLSTGQLSTLHICTGRDLVEGLKFENLKRFCILIGRSFYYDPYAYPRGTRVLYLGDVPGECSYLRNDIIPLVDKAEILHLENFKDLKKLLHDRGVVKNEFPDLRYLKVVSSDEMLHPSFLFNNLTELVVVNCKLKYLLSPTTAKGLAHLEVLSLFDCEIMEEIVGSEEQSEELTGEVKFSKLKELRLCNLPNLVCFYAKKEKKQTTISHTRPESLFDQQVSLPALDHLYIGKVPEIKKIWDVQPQLESGKDAQHWSKLQSVIVWDCDQLVCVFPSWMLPQLQNLKVLQIESCKEMEVIISSNKEAIRKDIIVFPKLETLELDSLPSLKSFFEETQLFFSDKVSLPALDHLRIEEVPEIKKIWDVQPQLESGKDAQHWSKLQSVIVRACDQLVCVFPSWMLPQLQNLQELSIHSCKEMEVIISSNKEAIRKDIIVFPKLESLWVSSLPNLESFFEETQLFFSDKVSLPALGFLYIEKVPEIKRIWDVQPQLESGKDAQHWSKLQSVIVRACDQLVCVFPSWILPQLQNLQELGIYSCKEMEVIISSNKEAIRNDIIVFPKLESLRVSSMPSLKSFFEETQLFFSDKDAFPVLKEIELDEHLEIFRNGTSMKEAFMEGCSTSGQKNDCNGEELDKDLEIPTKED